jgi:hypothetical protein
MFPFILIPFTRRFEKPFITATFEELSSREAPWIPIYSDCPLYLRNPNTLVPLFQAQSSQTSWEFTENSKVTLENAV